ncbi:unnamed protein product [Moneuplotes crassus]|uniref:Uncharacterized protein n=1 Tax=Euplotes crassus TaxID=5936 RepID=A0AAD1UIJ8_EUPCR|nr:unnamed protein product [Moneuplotes crassus]
MMQEQYSQRLDRNHAPIDRILNRISDFLLENSIDELELQLGF